MDRSMRLLSCIAHDSFRLSAQSLRVVVCVGAEVVRQIVSVLRCELCAVKLQSEENQSFERSTNNSLPAAHEHLAP